MEKHDRLQRLCDALAAEARTLYEQLDISNQRASALTCLALSRVIRDRIEAEFARIDATEQRSRRNAFDAE